MNITIKWVGIRRDRRHKTHLWGIVEVFDDTLYNGSRTHFVAWGPSCGPIKLTRIHHHSQIYSHTSRKMEDGYKEIAQNSARLRYPEFMKDISQLMLIEKLKDHGNKTT